MMRISGALLFISALPLAAAADELRYTYAEGGYQYLDIDGGGVDVDGDGLGMGGSLAITDRVHLLASYAVTDLNRGVDYSEFTLGVGGSWPSSDQVHLIGSIGYVSAEVDTRFGDFDDNGFYVSGGFRWMAAEQLELTAEVTYADLDDAGDDTSLAIGGLFSLTPELALGLGATFGDDVTGYTLGLRYYFPGLR